MKRLILCIILMTACVYASAQTYVISGTVTNKADGKPVEYATVILENTGQWAVADDKGKFAINNVQRGKNTISVSCLGFTTYTKEIIVERNIENYRIDLYEDNLALEGVVVTAQDMSNSATTSRKIDKTALDHVQLMNVTDISSLLPGGKTSTSYPSLTSVQRFEIRSGGSAEHGNSTFNTAVEVDGVRLSNNASFAGIKGIATNNIASSNVESVEVISGVPSVEYGDMGSGVVKINTKKGITPYTLSMSSNPRTKQISASKGFNLGQNRNGGSAGTINGSVEYTRSISDQMSPFSAYERKQMSLIYDNTLNHGAFADTPLRLTVGVTGNIGGMNTEADPDTFKDTFTKTKDNSVRANLNMNWLLSKSWITNLELKGSVVYSDKLSRERKNYSNSSGTIAMHGTEEGYFIAQDYESNPDAAVIVIPRGYWYNTMCIDDKPLNYSLGLKANWAKKINNVNNRMKVGFDWTGDGNFGIGEYSEDMSNAPTFREYPYNEVPFMNNIAFYLEDNITVPIGKTSLNVVAGIRNDNTLISGSSYGNTSSWSPRVNVKYTIFNSKNRRGKLITELAFRGSWGDAVKLPSFSVLYPTPTYRDIATFNPTTSADGSIYNAYYIQPRTIFYNEELLWQKNRQGEIGVDMTIGGHKISLAGFFNRTFNAYSIDPEYERFTYNYTPVTSLNGCTVPAENRRFEVDQKTGIVTVHDKTGAQSPQVLDHVVKEAFNVYHYASNDTDPTTRYGLEWTVDFKRIDAINTSIRFDGNYYGYRSASQDCDPVCPFTRLGADGNPFRYVAYYIGGDGISNGSEKQEISTNLTITTHIPKVRLIVSMKLEATLLRYQRYLSERKDGKDRSHVIVNPNDMIPDFNSSIYDGDKFPILYPDYYVSFDDPTPRDFYEDFVWAKDNDPQLFSDLSQFVVRSSHSYYFNKDYISPYFSANLSITKEIGNTASISLYANNFFRNVGQVYSTRTDTYSSISRYIPAFFYGVSLRFKF